MCLATVLIVKLGYFSVDKEEIRYTLREDILVDLAG